VIVALEDAPEQPKVKDAKPVVVDQVNWVFVPRVVAVQQGQAVRFDNSDNVNHSVMAISTVAKNQLNTVAGPGSPVTHTFEPQETPVLIGCSLHGWMRAWVYVSRHPWFGLSDAQGEFEIRQIPSGKYTLLLHHPDTNLRERKPIEIKGGQTLEVTVEWNRVGKKTK
jgi:plastocyanin